MTDTSVYIRFSFIRVFRSSFLEECSLTRNKNFKIMDAQRKYIIEVRNSSRVEFQLLQLSFGCFSMMELYWGSANGIHCLE